MRSSDRLLRITTVLAWAAAVSISAFAQTPAETPAPEAEPAQAAPAEPARPAAMTDGARIKLCHSKKKRNQPPEEWSHQPSQVGGEVTAPQIIHRTAPRFPLRNPQGTIVMEAIIDENGCVRHVKVTQGVSKAQDAAAVEAVRQWVFRPAMYNGQPVRVYYSLTVNYRQ